MTNIKSCLLCENYKTHHSECVHCEDWDNFRISEDGKALREKIYGDGYQDGHRDGYDKGYDDAQANNNGPQGEIIKEIPKDFVYDTETSEFYCYRNKYTGEEIHIVKAPKTYILERPQGDFTDLEREVIADSINYLLGAELLEENGYTEEVVNALKSVLQKIGAEEDHL